MKIFSFSTKNINVNANPSDNKNNSEKKSLYSPIKVNKKLPNLIKVDSSGSFKFYKISYSTKKKEAKRRKINLNRIIKINLINYNSYPYNFYIKITNQLLFNFPNHLVTIFKDNLIWNQKYDYIKNYFLLKKSKELLPKLGNYYQTYTLFIPIYFPLMDLQSIISKVIKNKKKYLEISENVDTIKDEIKDIDKNIIESNLNNENEKIINDNDKEITNKESNKQNNNNKLINTTEIKTENSCSVSNYFGFDSVIKFKDNSNYGENNNFENQLINYSLLNKIKNKHKNKKHEDKTNLDFSQELASIIQNFEENEKKYYMKRRTPSTKNYNAQNINFCLKNKFFSKMKKNKTNNKIYKKGYMNILVQN